MSSVCMKKGELGVERRPPINNMIRYTAILIRHHLALTTSRLFSLLFSPVSCLIPEVDFKMMYCVRSPGLSAGEHLSGSNKLTN